MVHESITLHPQVALTKARNWLQVLGAAELFQIDQGVSQYLHTIVPLLNILKTKEQPLEFVFPSKGPINTRS
jgi:hypothetical protein